MESEVTGSVPRIITGNTAGPVDAAAVPCYAGYEILSTLAARKANP